MADTPGYSVKNTFIDFADDAAPPPEDLRRAKSATVPRHVPQEDEDEDDEGAQPDDPPTLNTGTASSSTRPAGELPSFCLSGCVVKNTFIDFDDAPPPIGEGLVRSQTHTGVSARAPHDEELEASAARAPMDPILSEPSEFTSERPGSDDDLDEVGDLGAPPPPMPEPLVRHVTHDVYESNRDEEYWKWRGQQMAMSPQQMQQAPGQGQWPQGGVMYMVPVMPGIIGGQAMTGGPAPVPQQPAPQLTRLATPGEPPPGTPSSVAEAPDFSALAATVDVPQAPVLERAKSKTRPSVQRVRWRIDARTLKRTDREHVSPSFGVDLALQTAQFKILLKPKVVHDARGGASFKKAKGKGVVELKCLDRLDASMKPRTKFHIAVNPDGEFDSSNPPRGPSEHDFSQHSTCGLPKSIEEWDFAKYVDPVRQSFFVVVEIQPEQ